MIQLDARVWQTLVGLFAATYAVQLCAILRGGVDSPEFPLWIAASMFLPGVFALAHLRREGTSWRSIGWRLGSVRAVMLALTIPAVLTLVAFAAIEASGFGWQPALIEHEDGSLTLELPLLLDTERISHAALALNVFVTGLVLSLVTGLLTLGEEIGWRGFFQGKLLERNGLFPSVIFLGVAWALWHAPIILAGFNYERTPVLGAFVYFPIAAVGVSGWLAWLTLWSRSVWPAVFFHAGINSVGTVVFGMRFGERDALGQLAISFGLLISGLGALWIWSRRERGKPLDG